MQTRRTCRPPFLQPRTQEHTISPRKSTETPLSPEQIKALIFTSLDADKAEDIEIIDLDQKSSLADYIVIATGTSSRHVSALAGKLVDKLLEAGVKSPRTEGERQGDWVIVDAGDVIVHLFRPEVRAFYNIEKMWRAAPMFDMVSAQA